MAFTVPATDPIDYLVRRKYPNAPTSALAMVRHEVEPNAASQEQLRLYEAAQAYKAELKEKSLEEIDGLYAHELEKEEETREQGRFFNHPRCRPDYSHWNKTAYWTLDEATSLLLDRDPSSVSEETIRDYRTAYPSQAHKSKFVKRYLALSDLMERSRYYGELQSNNAPQTYLSWAQKKGIAVPEELVAALVKSGQVTNWEGHCRDLEAQLSREKETHSEAISEKNRELQAAQLQVSLLQAQIAREQTTPEKPILPKERTTVSKLIIGMAVAGYSYDPKAAKSSIPQEITDDLLRLGISLDVDTVRNRLKEAASELPSDAEIEPKQKQQNRNR